MPSRWPVLAILKEKGDPMAGSFIQELKRRNVFRVAAIYVVVSWLLLQIGDGRKLAASPDRRRNVPSAAPAGMDDNDAGRFPATGISGRYYFRLGL